MHPVRVVFAFMVLLVPLSSISASVRPAYAATITVNTTADEFDTLPATGTGCSLREAIQAANADSPFGGCGAGLGDDVISLPAGVFTITRTGAVEDANVRGDLDILSNVAIVGAGAAATRIVGTGADRALHILSAVTVRIEVVTLTNGSAQVVRGEPSGGGIYNNGGTAALVNSTFSGNTSTFDGGAILNNSAGTIGVLTISHVTFHGNDARRDGDSIGNTAGGTVSLRASVLQAGSDDNCLGTIISQGSNVAGGNDTSCFANAGSDKVVADLRSGPLTDNGGPTATHALLPVSAAIDAVVHDCDIAVDQRGFGRPVDGDEDGTALCDSGAFERRPSVEASGAAEAAQAEAEGKQDDDDDKSRETEEQRQQCEHTNQNDRDDYYTATLRATWSRSTRTPSRRT